MIYVKCLKLLGLVVSFLCRSRTFPDFSMSYRFGQFSLKVGSEAYRSRRSKDTTGIMRAVDGEGDR